MKRSGPPKRKKGLRKQPLTGQAQPLLRRAPLRRGNGLKRAPATETQREDRRAKQADLSPKVVPFRARQPARGFVCIYCVRGASTWHHWTPQQTLRGYVLSLRLTRKEARRLLRLLLRDERNLSPMCFPCHGQREHSSRGFAEEDVPDCARDFARELGEWAVVRLEKAYPPRSAADISGT